MLRDLGAQPVVRDAFDKEGALCAYPTVLRPPWLKLTQDEHTVYLTSVDPAMLRRWSNYGVPIVERFEKGKSGQVGGIGAASAGRGLVQANGSSNQGRESLLIDSIVLVEVDRAPGVAFEA